MLVKIDEVDKSMPGNKLVFEKGDQKESKSKPNDANTKSKISQNTNIK